MYHIDVRIKGIAPILYNKFTEEAIEKIDTGKAGGRRTKKKNVAEVEDKLWKNDEGLFVPDTWLKRAMIRGAGMGGVKQGRRSFAPFLEATVFIEPREIPTGRKTYDFIDERMGRRPPRTGGACIIRRAAIDNWELAFSLMVIDDTLPIDNIRASLDAAGIYVGIGSGIPEFGRFMVDKFERRTE